jgi:hypothetical protein
MSREIKNAIQMGNLASLSAVAAGIQPGDTSTHVIGYVIGRATGISQRSNPNGEEPSLAMFEATPTEAGRAIMVAPVIFLPTAFCKMLADKLRGDQKLATKAPPKGKHIDIDGVAEIPLALEIGIRKSGGERGYEFSVVAKNDSEMEKTDALADLRQYIPETLVTYAASAAQLAAPKKSKSKRK